MPNKWVRVSDLSCLRLVFNVQDDEPTAGGEGPGQHDPALVAQSAQTLLMVANHLFGRLGDRAFKDQRVALSRSHDGAPCPLPWYVILSINPIPVDDSFGRERVASEHATA